MADNKLSLIVQFMGMDKLTPALKSIIGLGKQGKVGIGGLKKEAKDLDRQMRDVGRQIERTSGNVTSLITRERDLAMAIERVNGTIRQRTRLMAIDGRTAAMRDQGHRYVSEGRAGLMWAGVAMAPIYAMAKAGGEMEGMTNRLRVLGLGDSAVKNLTAYASAMDVAGSSVKENLRYIVEAQGAFRESGEHSLAEQLSGAKTMAPILAKLMTTTKALGHELSEDQERYFLRFIEQAGGMTDPKRAAALSDGLFRAIQSSGGNVNPANYQSFMAKAGSAAGRMSARSMFADFEPLIAELHESAGVGLAGIYSRANGMNHNQAAMREMIRLGAWNKDAIVWNKVGGIKDFKRGANPLKANLADQLATSPVDFYMSLRKLYQAQGVKDIQRENVLLYGKSGGLLLNLIEKQLPTILKSREAYKKTESLDTAYNQTKDSFFGRQGQMTAAWQNFLVVAGTKGGLLDQMTVGLRMATGALQGITAFGNAHPTAFRWIATAVTSLIGLRIGLSVVKIAFGYLLGPVAQLWGLWSKYRVLGSLAALFPRLAGVMGFARVAVLGLGRAFLLAGTWMLANPIVLITAAIIAGGVAIYIYRKQIGQAFTSIRTWFSKQPAWFQNTGSMILRALLNAFPPTALAMRFLEMSKTAKQSFKDFWGIKSPSRVMMEMGGHIATGLGMGVDNHAHRPRQAMRRMGTAMAGALAVGSPGMADAHGARGGNTINVYQLPGEDGEALARRVADLLDQRHRAHRLSSYADDF